ncbi:septum formation protein Maf [Pandoraea pnomenusa]|uniref:Maf-like protein n=1 Tax=Pandoraea pnomenusa TaxID=93220 RepID=UPI001198B2BC|nr:Maf-like protein [Pandoraea pnomenusa]QDX23218.1 septum formation protein Maf [Pandoraea pnomenusa]
MTAQPHPPLILASGSRYRLELLERLRLPFSVDVPDIDETPAPGETPRDTSLRLAREKAVAVAARRPGAVIIGSDQVATFEGRQIGKPGNFENAMAQLRDMRGKTVEFHSALCVYDARNGETQATDVVTRVKFRDLPDTVLAAYLHAETPYDCAGSAKSEGLGIMLLESIENDDPTALIGLPLIALTSMLMRAGIALPGAAPALAGSAA